MYKYINFYIVFGGILLVGLILSFVLPIDLFIGKQHKYRSQGQCQEPFENERKALKIRYLKNDPWKPDQMKEWNTTSREEQQSLTQIQQEIQGLFKRYQTILEAQAVGATKQYESWKTMSPQVRILANQKENPVEKFYNTLIDPSTKTSRVLGSQSMEYPSIVFQKSLPQIVIPEPPIAPSPEISPETTGVDRDIVEIPFYEKVPTYLVSIPSLLPTLQDNVKLLQESIAGKSKNPEEIPEYSLYERVEQLRISTEKAKRDAQTLNKTQTQTQTQTDTETKEGFEEQEPRLDIVVPEYVQSISVIQKRIAEVYEPMKKVLEELERKMTKTEQTLKELQEDAEKVKQANS
jgi:hypothetical protein